MSEETENAMVRERKFNGVATLEIDAPNKKVVRAAARQFWRDEYGGSPSQIVIEEEEHGLHGYTVMVADHSSGSLKDTRSYEF